MKGVTIYIILDWPNMTRKIGFFQSFCKSFETGS